MPTRAIQASDSLAAINTGESFEVVHILFDSLRAFGAARGVRYGTRLHCRADGAATIVLETERGETVLFPRDLARFVRVRRLGDPDLDAAEPANIGGERRRWSSRGL